MSVFVLKIIAVLAMVIDHISYVLTLAFRLDTPLLFHMRAVGRMAFPIYAFLLVNGFEKTRDKMGYMERLSLFALISQLPFSLAFNGQNYMEDAAAGHGGIALSGGWQLLAALMFFCLTVYFFLMHRSGSKIKVLFPAALCLTLFQAELSGIVVWGEMLNVFYTLAVSLAVLWSLEYLSGRLPGRCTGSAVLTLCACAALCFCILPRSDYGFKGLVLIAALYLVRSSKWAQPAVTALWAYWMYSYSKALLLGALAACVPIIFYNRQLGKKMKTVFYLIYPVHLYVLFLLAFYIVKMR